MKKVITVFLAAAFAFTAFACGPRGDMGTKEFVEPDFSLDGKMNVSWMIPTQNTVIVSETPIMKYTASRFNMAYNVTEFSPQEFDVQLELNVSNRQIKDVVTRIDLGLANEYGGYGAFMDFKPYIDGGYMPNVKKMLDRALAENPNNKSFLYDTEGRIFRIPGYNANPMPIYNFSYNRAAFKAVGYENPTTWDDYFNALVAIKGGNANQYPFKLRKLGPRSLGTQITNFLISFTGGYAHGQEFIGYDPTADRFKFGMEVPGYKEGVKFFNKMYNAGLIDPGYSTMDSTKLMEAMQSGECVMTCDFMGGYTGETGYEDKTGAFVPVSLPTAPGKAATHGFTVTQLEKFAGTAVNSVVKNNPVKLGRVLKMLDYMYSDEFITLQWYYPEAAKGSYPAGVTDPTKYVYEKDGDGNYIYKDSIFLESNLATTKNEYFNWGLYANFYNLNDPVSDKRVAPHTEYYKFRERLLTEKDKYVNVPTPVFNSNEYKKIKGANTNLNIMYDIKIIGLLTGSFSSDSAFDAAYQNAVRDIKSEGGDTLVTQYNNAYNRMKA